MLRNTCLFIIGFVLLMLAACQQQKQVPQVHDFDESCRQLALNDNVPKQCYAITKKLDEVYDLDVCYLGSIKTNGDSLIKFVSMVRYLGMVKDSPKANGKVYLYNEQNIPLGFYYVGGALGVPERIAGSSLIFNYSDNGCNHATAISFADSIPQEMYLACNEKQGDMRKFERGAEVK